MVLDSGDTDTNVCIVSGLAGLFYGKNSIPERCSSKLLKKNEMLELAERWERSVVLVGKEHLI